MAQEIERSYVVNPALLPSLEGLPYEDITQTYYTPYPANPQYPEVADGEWRVRTSRNTDGKATYTAAVKFGDKADGSRTEIETELTISAFGVALSDQHRYGRGNVIKRRFHMPDGSMVDKFDSHTHGPLWTIEREFESKAALGAWQPPDYAVTDSKPPENRFLAIPYDRRTKGLTHESIQSRPLEEVMEELCVRQRRLGKLAVTVSGFSGSGKTTLARQLAERLGCNLLSADNYHIGATALKERYGQINHDWPSTYNMEKVARDSQALLNGDAVLAPCYSFLTAEPDEVPMLIQPINTKFLVIEGLYANLISHKSLDPTYSIFVTTPFYAAILRRLKRDAPKADEPIETKRAISMTPEESLRYLHEIALPTYSQNSPAIRSPFDVTAHNAFDAFMSSPS